MNPISTYIQHYLTWRLLLTEHYNATASERPRLRVERDTVNNLLDQMYIAMSVDERDETFSVLDRMGL